MSHIRNLFIILLLLLLVTKSLAVGIASPPEFCHSKGHCVIIKAVRVLSLISFSFSSSLFVVPLLPLQENVLHRHPLREPCDLVRRNATAKITVTDCRAAAVKHDEQGPPVPPTLFGDHYTVSLDTPSGTPLPLNISRQNPSLEVQLPLSGNYSLIIDCHNKVFPCKISYEFEAAPQIPYPPFTPPTVSVIPEMDGFLAVAWSTSANDKGAFIDQYQLQMRFSTSSTWKTVFTGSSLAFNVTGLPPSSLFSFRVSAHNVVGWSTPSPDSALVETLPAPPSHPEGLLPQKVDPTSATILVQPSDEELLQEIDSYGVEQQHGSHLQLWCLAGSTAISSTNSSGNVPVSVAPLVPGEAQLLRAVAHNPGGWGDGSGPITVHTPPAPWSSSQKVELGILAGGALLFISGAAILGTSAFRSLRASRTETKPLLALNDSDKYTAGIPSKTLRSTRVGFILIGVALLACVSAAVVQEVVRLRGSNGPIDNGDEVLPAPPTAVAFGVQFISLSWVSDLNQHSRIGPVTGFILQILDYDSCQSDFADSGAGTLPNTQSSLLICSMDAPDTIPGIACGAQDGSAIRSPLIIPGHQYHFRLQIQFELGTSLWSSPDLVVYTPPPGAPDPVTIVFDEATPDPKHELRIAWIAPYDEGSSVVGYSLELCPAASRGPEVIKCASGSGWQLVCNTNSTIRNCLASGLLEDSPYLVRLQASNSIGASAWSSSFPFETASNHPRAPSQPSPVTTAQPPGYTDCTLQWFAPSDGGSPILSYDLRCGSKEYSGLLPLPQPQYYVDDLDASQSYLVSVRASNAVGPGPWSEPASFRTRAPALPDPPSQVTVDIPGYGHTWLLPQWPAVSKRGEHGSAVTGYVLEANTTAQGWTELYRGPLRTFNVTGLDPGTAYAFRVAAINAIGQGPFLDPPGVFWAVWIGNCGDEEDIALFQKYYYTFVGICNACGVHCGLGSDVVECVTQCIGKSVPLSPPCMSCVAEDIVCIQKHCLKPCVLTQGGPPCVKCINEWCSPSYFACTGLPDWCIP